MEKTEKRENLKNNNNKIEKNNLILEKSLNKSSQIDKNNFSKQGNGTNNINKNKVNNEIKNNNNKTNSSNVKSNEINNTKNIASDKKTNNNANRKINSNNSINNNTNKSRESLNNSKKAVQQKQLQKNINNTNRNDENIIINKANQSKKMISKENIKEDLQGNHSQNFRDNTIVVKKNNTILDQETKVYNFQKELNIQRLKNNEKENKESNVKSRQDLIKEAEKIANSAVAEAKKEKDKNNNTKTQKIEKKANKNGKRKGLVVFLILLIIALILTIFSTIFGVLNLNNDKIIKGVCINNIDVSNLTKEEALTKLENQLNSENNYIIVKYNNYAKEIYLKDINAKFDVKDAVNIAHRVGRDNNIVHNNYKTLLSMIAGSNVNVNLTFDEDLLQQQIDIISLDLPGIASESSYVIDGNNLVIKNSKSGIQIKSEAFKENMINAFAGTEKSFEIPTENCERKEINIEQIYNEVYKKPVDAYYTTNPYQIFKEENGLDFAITLDEAKNMLIENKEEYIIPLKTVAPKITVANLDSKAFPDKLGTFTTYYSASDVNRNANIALAAKSITSVVLMPGEVFSYNDLIGECSTRTGYKESTIYLNGELAKGVGGGICQVSTTLYNAVLRANLEIVQRRNHSLSVTYVPLGQDAMVSIGSQDFQFKNNRNYPIKVVATTNATSITCQIIGLKQDTEYEVKLYSRVISKTDTKTKVETYKLLYLNGKEVSRTWLSTDTYKNH